MQVDHQVISTYLDRAIEEFDTNPIAVRFMRRLANEGPRIFFGAAIERLSGEAHSNAHRFLTLLVLRQDSLLRQLTSPAFSTRDHAVNLFRRFLEVDPLSDVRLAQMLPGRNAMRPILLNGVQSARALDILDATSRGRRLLPLLGHLPDSGDPMISAKATLFVGRRILSPEWAARQMLRSNQRARANAIESLWGVKSPAAVQLFEDHVDDGNHRVSGNSLVGLHVAEHTGIDDLIDAKSRNFDPVTRTAACWAMGKIAMRKIEDEAFFKRLVELTADGHLEVQATAVRALNEMGRSISTPTESTKPAAVLPVAENLTEDLAPATDTNEPAELPQDVEIRLDGSSFRAKRQ